ncbi:putative F-box protein PP2-B2 [Arachis duranensis]|uniref:F-box protein PP2-B2 n=1 Tax=Arachis duranensis TaxID=130453 RepID=A0A6P4D4L6_ARADU|nr:putative F-box protein PP2-B2 [Arachis duranensis]
MVMVMVGEGVGFQDLPEGCIANVVSLTIPRDACSLALVSSTFRSAAESDSVWDRFLPSDYNDIVSQSTSFSCRSKKQLYLSLCENPILVDDGKKSFQLDKAYGKKCYMLSPRMLSIV